MFDQILKSLGGGNIADIETNAKDLLTRLEKLGCDVIGSNGNVLAAVVSLAEDFGTVKSAIGDLKQIVVDLQTLHASMRVTPNLPTSSPAAPAAPVSSPAPAVSVTSILSAAEQVAAVAVPAIAAVAKADPFAPKPLAAHVTAAPVNEPHGGA